MLGGAGDFPLSFCFNVAARNVHALETRSWQMMAEKHVNSVVDSSEVPRAEGQEKEKVPFSVKSISVQSVTMSEFFYRCSTDFPQLEFGNKKEKETCETCRLFFGQGFNLDEAYEWFENLSLLGCPGGTKGVARQ